MATEALKLDDAEGGSLYVTRIEDVGYTLGHVPALDENGNALPFRLLDNEDIRRLRSFLKPTA